MVCATANMIANATGLSSYFAYIVNACGQLPVLCILGSHLLIHLKEAGETGMNEGTSYKPEISSMNFAGDHVASGIQCMLLR